MEHTPDFATVTYRGTTYNFSTKQRAVVMELWKYRDRALSQEHLLQRAGSDGRRLRDLFKKGKTLHPGWGVLILGPAQHRKGKDLYLIASPERFPQDLCSAPAKTPTGPPRRPQAPSQTESRVEDEGASRGDEDVDLQNYNGPLNDVIFYMAERNFVRVILEWSTLRAAFTREELEAEADSLDALPLWKGLSELTQAAAEQETSLSDLEEELDGLANAWWPIDLLEREAALIQIHDGLPDSREVIDQKIAALRKRAEHVTYPDYTPAGLPQAIRESLHPDDWRRRQGDA